MRIPATLCTLLAVGCAPAPIDLQAKNLRSKGCRVEQGIDDSESKCERLERCGRYSVAKVSEFQSDRGDTCKYVNPNYDERTGEALEQDDEEGTI